MTDEEEALLQNVIEARALVRACDAPKDPMDLNFLTDAQRRAMLCLRAAEDDYSRAVNRGDS